MTDKDESDPMSDDGMFDDAPVSKTKEPEAEKVEAVTAETKPETAEVKTETKVETTTTEQKSVPIAALLDERRKRQALEEENRVLKGGKAIDPASEALQRTIDISRDLILDSHKDYPEMEKVFMDLVSEPSDGGLRIKDTALYEKFRNSANPAKFAYNHAKQHKDYLDKSSPDYEKKLREKITAEVVATLKGPDVSKLTNLTNLAASANNTETPKESSAADDEGVWD